MKLRSIQLLRAVAIILVVYAHSIDLQMRFSHSFQQDFFYLQNFGAFGVDLFFVVSGFVISMAAERYAGPGPGFRFLARRFIRLNPVYYLVSGFVLLMNLWRPHAITGTASQTGAIWKTILLLPFFDKVSWIDPLLYVGWTLAFEWLFYIQFFIAILCAPEKKEWLTVTLITGMVLLGILFKSGDPRWIFLTAPIQLEFLLGMMIYRLFTLDVRPELAATISRFCLLTGVGFCVWLIFTGFGNDLEMGVILNQPGNFTRIIHWATASGLLVAGFTFMEKNHRKIHPPAWLLRCGDASYSIYLTHTIVFRIAVPVYLRAGFPPAPDGVVFLQLLAALLVGIGFYQWVEAPLLHRLRILFRL
ncbi:MAG: acyltransferase [Puia sp.]|nr:acyltransferase [Puia sp.]